jgi:hypothetical protein
MHGFWAVYDLVGYLNDSMGVNSRAPILRFYWAILILGRILLGILGERFAEIDRDQGGATDHTIMIEASRVGGRFSRGELPWPTPNKH